MLRAVSLGVLLTLIVSVPAHAEEIEMLNHPVNLYGLTGLLHATMPYTLARGSFEIGVGTMTEQSYEPNYAVTGLPASITFGLKEHMEIALRWIYWKEKELQVIKRRGMGDAELSWKWNLLPPKEYSSRPSVALLLTGIAPTGDRDAGNHDVKRWGARVGLAVGTEIPLEDYIIGVYADGQAVVQDLSDISGRDWYHLANAGFLMPISKYRNLQMFIEYSRQKGKDVVRLRADDYSAVAYGLRLVNSRFNITVGTQFIHKFADNQGNSSRIIGMASIKF